MKQITMPIPGNEFILVSGTDAKSGDIYLANSNAFNDTFMSTPLTTYAMNWNSTDGLEAELEFLAPAVPTTRKFEYRVADNAEAFIAETDDSDIRAMDATFKTVASRGSIELAKTINKGLTFRLDTDDIEDNPMAEEQAVASLKGRLLRAEIYRAAKLLETSATMNPKSWTTGTTADSDPDSDLLVLVDASGQKVGVDPNRVVFGRGAWLKRVRALRANMASGGFLTVNNTTAELADYLAVDAVMRSRAMRSVTADAKNTLVATNKVFAFMALANASREDPSNIKRFTSPINGSAWMVYRQEVNATTVDITVAHRSNIIITSTLGIVGLDVA